MTVSRQGRKGFGFTGGFLNCLNIQAGTIDISPAGAAGSTAHTFEKQMDRTPVVILKSADTDALVDDEIYYATSVSNEGFTGNLYSTATKTITTNFLAIDTGRFAVSPYRAGWKSGNYYCRNIQSGLADITTDGSGNGTALDVTFPAPFRNVPVVLLTTQESITSGKPWFSGKPTRNGFQIDVTGSSVTSGIVTIGWIAIDTAPWSSRANEGTNLPTTGDYKLARLPRPGAHAGYLYAKNIQSGVATIITDGNGDGTAKALTLIQSMNLNYIDTGKSLQRTPLFFAEPQEADATGNTVVTSGADTGGTLDVTDSAVLSGSLTVGWVAIAPWPIFSD